MIEPNSFETTATNERYVAASAKYRDTALDFTPGEISMWSSTTQAVSHLASAHFALFNDIESGKMTKGKANKARKALGSIYRAAAYLRATCNPNHEAFDSRFVKA